MIKLAIIGIGNVGSAHGKTVLSGAIEGMTLRAVCDIDPTKNGLSPDIPFYTDYRQLLQTDIDAVIISVPHPLHADIAMAAFEAGKHVLVEKPADITVSKARKMNDAAGDRVFGIMFNQRTGNLFQKAREIMQQGLLGQLKRTDWIITNWYRTQAYYDSGDWRATWVGEGGGVLMNQAPHQLDLWQWICGMPEAVYAQCATSYHQIEVEDSVCMLARFPGGATGSFTTSTGEFPGTNRLEIVGTMGKIVLEDGKLKWWRLQEDERSFCRSCPESYGKIPFTYEEFDHIPTRGHQLILQDFAHAILKGTPLLAPGVEGINALAIQNAAYLSAWTDSWVSIPFDEAQYDRLLALKQAGQTKKSVGVTEGHTDYSPRWQINW